MLETKRSGFTTILDYILVPGNSSTIMAPPNDYDEPSSFAPAQPSPRQSLCAHHRRSVPHASSCSRCFRREKSRCRLRRLSSILPVTGTMQEAVDNLTLPAPAASFIKVRFHIDSPFKTPTFALHFCFLAFITL
ncbi:hypothetical protein ElyMa_005979700 [Elysia marginata]|uniref:Uncharacterized protein n=1 Tax=Elysia marginata TaxID=1093978 RepID=A0AAV4GDP2_9GAST|nr:hypothetical protein ElyMa_005979700 [Elysia marginata]